MSFIDKAIEAVMGNDKFQTYVRTFITSHSSDVGLSCCADTVAVEIGNFRGAIEPWVQEGETRKEVNDRRKKVNNIINDTSRISRELLGFTIKCTSRKNHHYEAVLPAPRSKSESSEYVPPTPFKIITASNVPADVKLDIVLKTIDEEPNWLLGKLLEKHGGAHIGGEVARILREGLDTDL